MRARAPGASQNRPGEEQRPVLRRLPAVSRPNPPRRFPKGTRLTVLRARRSAPQALSHVEGCDYEVETILEHHGAEASNFNSFTAPLAGAAAAIDVAFDLAQNLDPNQRVSHAGSNFTLRFTLGLYSPLQGTLHSTLAGDRVARTRNFTILPDALALGLNQARARARCSAAGRARCGRAADARRVGATHASCR